jgi:hypothetical protein
MTTQAEMDPAQDLATDCSVVASLCAAARHLGPTKDSVSILYLAGYSPVTTDMY